jgi:hypothetical protein
MTRTAEQELRRHARERHRRAAVASQDMEAAMTLVRDDAEPRMSHEQWVTSLGLMRGVGPVDEKERESFWRMLELYYCGRHEDAPARRRQEVTPHPRFSPGPGDTGAREWAATLPVWPEDDEPPSSGAMVAGIAAAMTLHEAADKVGIGPRAANRLHWDALAQVAENQARKASGEARGQ